MKRCLMILLVHMMFFGNIANSRTISDVYLPEKIPSEENRPELTLNGASLRHLYLQVKSHVCSLYLENPSTSATQILADKGGYKRMVFHVLMKKVSARRLTDIFNEALAINYDNNELEKLVPSMKQFQKIHSSAMVTGDELYFDYIPEVGTEIFLNGEKKGVIEGDELFHALLTSWIGDKPVNREFKKQILGVTGDEQQDTQFSSTN